MIDRPVALVTGASRGIGRAIADDLITRGWLVAALARDADALAALAADSPESVLPLVADVTDSTAMAQAMAALRRVARPGSLVVILSDFQGFTRSAQSYLSAVARHNEVLAVFLSDPIERELPPPGRYRLVSGDDELAIDTFAKAARRDYETAFARRSHDLEAFCQRYGVHLMSLSTADDPVSALQTALGRRTH